MKAIVVNSLGGPEKLTFDEMSSPAISADQLLIDVHYAGVNFPDTLIIQGKYQFQPEMPFSPGGEVSGIVSKVGGQVQHIKPGDRVISGCGWGGYAQQVASFGTNTYLFPDELPLREGAALLQTYATTYHALIDRGNAKARETMLVLGAAGGTGTAAVQLGKALGLNVIACASTSEKRAFCLEQGADHVLDSSDPEFRNELKKIASKGIDIVYDPVGGPLSETAFRSLGFGGRHLVIGFAQGEIPKIPWNLPLLKSASIVGVFWGGFFRDFPEANKRNVEALFELWLNRKIKPIVSKEYSLADADKALISIQGQTAKGKLVLNCKD